MIVGAFLFASCTYETPSSAPESAGADVPVFSDNGITFTPHDHTLIVKAIGDNMLGEYGVLAHLPKDKENITGEDVLRAALEVEAIPDSIKTKIKVILQYAPSIEEARNSISPELQEKLNEIKAKLDEAKSPEDMITILQEMKSSGKYKDIDNIDCAFDFAIGIIEDGLSSIYSPDYEPGYAPHICTLDNSGQSDSLLPDSTATAHTGIDVGELAGADVVGAIEMAPIALLVEAATGGLASPGVIGVIAVHGVIESVKDLTDQVRRNRNGANQ